MTYERTRSDQPEPVPEREEGYYWIEDKDHDPFIAYYGATYINDQKLSALGKLTGNQILCSYDWDMQYEEDSLDEATLKVLGDRLVCPKD